MATEVDDRGASGEWREVEHAWRNETWDVVALDYDLDYFQSIPYQVRDDEGVLRKKTKV